MNHCWKLTKEESSRLSGNHFCRFIGDRQETNLVVSLLAPVPQSVHVAHHLSDPLAVCRHAQFLPASRHKTARTSESGGGGGVAMATSIRRVSVCVCTAFFSVNLHHCFDFAALSSDLSMVVCKSSFVYLLLSDLQAAVHGEADLSQCHWKDGRSEMHGSVIRVDSNNSSSNHKFLISLWWPVWYRRCGSGGFGKCLMADRSSLICHVTLTKWGTLQLFLVKRWIMNLLNNEHERLNSAQFFTLPKLNPQWNS